MKTWKSSLAVSAVLLSFAAPVPAQTMPPAFRGASVPQSGVQVQYATGGFGLDDRAEMKREAGAYNVLLMFGEPTGQFVVADSVTVKKGQANILEVSDAGPLLYLNLPNGTYVVEANYNGVRRSRAINVVGRTPDVLMTWPGALSTN